MSNEADSSRAGLRHADTPALDEGPELAEEEERMREQRASEATDTRDARERRLDAKRKRIVFLGHLLKELDCIVFVELVAMYHLDCSFFWFAVRTLIHVTLLTPLPDLQLARQHDEHKAFLPLILFTLAVNFLLHVLHRAPSAGEETRGYLHGGLMIDFIGQQGPTSKWKLVGLDVAIMLLQLIMVSVHVKKRDLKKSLAKISGGTTGPTSPEAASSIAEGGNAAGQTTADREQDADAEERGLRRRADTLSDTGDGPDEEDVLLPSSSGSSPADALDMLSSGQCVIGDFTLIDTLLREHADYQVYRQTRSETSASSGLSPDALRQLHTIRLRFGVGGG